MEKVVSVSIPDGGLFMPNESNYKQASPSALFEHLEKYFQNLELDEAPWRASGSNHIILTAGKKEDRIDALIEAVSRTAPGRFFVVSLGDEYDQLKAFVSARCHGVSLGKAVCSEIMMITAPAKEASAVPSILCANTLTGRPINLYLQDADVCVAEGSPYFNVADALFFDSQDFLGNNKFIEAKIAPLMVIDRQWLRLEQWRNVMEQAFERLPLRTSDVRVQGFEIHYSNTSEKSAWVAPHLLAAWMFSCLGIESLQGSGGRFSGLSRKGKVQGAVVTKVGGTERAIETVKIDFDEGDSTHRTPGTLIIAANSEGVEIIIKRVSEEARSIVPMAKDGLADILARSGGDYRADYSRLLSQAFLMIGH
jgi:glucose-6-phosphate dehydrogenase assembly protein OpcA